MIHALRISYLPESVSFSVFASVPLSVEVLEVGQSEEKLVL